MSVHKTDGVDGVNNEPKDTVILHGTGAINAGDAVMIDVTDTTNGLGYSVKATDTNGSPLAFGVARETISAAGDIKVQYKGKYDGVTNREGVATAVGDRIQAAGGTGGEEGGVMPMGAPAKAVGDFAVALEIAADDATLAIMIIDKGWF